MKLSDATLNGLNLLNAICSLQGVATPYTLKVNRPFFSKNKKQLLFYIQKEKAKTEISLSDELAILFSVKPSQAAKLVNWLFQPLTESLSSYRSTPDFFDELKASLSEQKALDPQTTGSIVVCPIQTVGLDYLIDSDRFLKSLPKLFDSGVFGKAVEKQLLPLYEQQVLEQEIHNKNLTSVEISAKNSVRI